MIFEPGKPVVIEGRIFMLCPDCKKLIRMDKPFFGSLHICEETHPPPTRILWDKTTTEDLRKALEIGGKKGPNK